MDQPPGLPTDGSPAGLPGSAEPVPVARSRAPVFAAVAVLIGGAVGGFLAWSARTNPDQAPLKSGWNRHTVKAAGFNLGLPPGWRSVSTTNVDTAFNELKDANPELATMVRNELGSSLSKLIKLLAFDVNSPTLAKQFATNLNIVVAPLQNGVTFAQFLKQDLTQIESVHGILKGEVQSQRLELPAGESALIHADLTLNAPGGAQVTAISQYLLLRGRIGYILSFSTLPSHLNFYAPLFDEIARTFRYQ